MPNLQDSLSTIASSLGQEPNMLLIYGVKVEIDTTPSESTPTWAELCAGIENIEEGLNETIQQYFFLCGKGGANNFVTSMAPAYTITGRRIMGDAAQDFIFGATQKYGLMKSRQTHMRLTKSGATENEVISANVTFCNLVEVNGAVNDGSEISIELRFDGQIVSGDAWAD